MKRKSTQRRELRKEAIIRKKQFLNPITKKVKGKLKCPSSQD